MQEIKVTITDNEWKALAYVAVSPEEWINNLVHARAAGAMQEIYEEEIRRMTADPNVTTIPADRDEVIAGADIKSAAERQLEFLANPPIPPEPAPEPKEPPA